MKKKQKKLKAQSEFEEHTERQRETQSKFIKFLNAAYFRIFKKPSIAKQLLFWYLAFTLLGGLILWTPLALEEGVTISFIDAMFTSASAISDTGLTTVPTSSTFSFFGEFIIMMLIIIGGIGWFAIKIFIINWFLFRRMRFRTHEQAKERLGTVNSTHTLGIIKVAVISTVFMIMLFGPLFGWFFATQDPIAPIGLVEATPGSEWHGLTYADVNPNLKGNWSESMWSGYFLAASAINNAGFDVLRGGYSMLAYYGNYGLQVCVMFLFIFGGVGFSIVYDILFYFGNKTTKHRFTFSMTTKVGLVAYWSIALVGLTMTMTSETILYYISPTTSFLGADNGYGTMGQRYFAIFFNTFSTRNAGFSTIFISDFSQTTLFTFSMLMFIGSGPGSTAGGIRTTTMAVLVLALWNHMRGRKETIMFNRKISNEQVKDSFAIFAFSIFIVAFLMFVLLIGESADGSILFINTLIIATSAFGTTGLSTMDLSTLTIASKFFVLVVMFIGQLGAGTTMKQFRSQKMERSLVYHVEESISLG